MTLEIGTFTPDQTHALWQWYLSQQHPGARWKTQAGSPHRLVILNEILYDCTDPFTDPLPEAAAEFIKDASGGGRELSGVTIQVQNIGNLAYAVDTIGYVIDVCGIVQFCPLDCPQPSSSSTTGVV